MTTGAVSGHSLTLTAEGDVLAGARGITISWAQGTIDVTSADSSWKGEYLPGRIDVTIDVDALFIYNDVAKKVLLNHINERSPTTVTCVVTTPDSATYTGEGIVTSLSYSGGHESEISASATIQITDGLTISAS